MPMSTFRADGAQFQRPTDAEFNMKAVLAGLPIAAQRQTSNLHCHPSLQDCTRASRHRLADALPAIKGKAVTVSSQLFRALRPLHNCQLTVLVYAPPAPHRGEHNRPGSVVPRSTQSSDNPLVNIKYRDCVTPRATGISRSGVRRISEGRHSPQRPTCCGSAQSILC